MTAGRNEPCPCGSGKKYKKCCAIATSAVTLPTDIGRAYAAYSVGNLPLAFAEIRAVLSEAPDHPEGNHLAGLLNAQLGHFLEARIFLERAASLSRDNAYVHSNLSMVLNELQEFDAARKVGQCAVDLNPRLSEAWNNLANAFRSAGELDVALNYYHQAMSLDPAKSVYLENVAHTQLQMGHAEQAAVSFSKLLQQKPDSFVAMAGLGAIAMVNMQWTAARDWLLRALQNGCRTFQLFDNLGITFRELKDYSTSLDYFKRAISFDSKNADVWYHMATLLDQCENRKAAVRAYQEAYDRGLRSLSFRLAFLESLTANRQLDDAHARALELIPEARQNPVVLVPVLHALGTVCDFENVLSLWVVVDKLLENEEFPIASLDALLLFTLYLDFISDDQVLEYHRKWAETVESSITTSSELCAQPHERRRLAYLSADFNAHSVGYFIQHILTNHDRQEFEVTCYSNSPRRDHVTVFIEQNVEKFIPVYGLDHDALVKRIREDEIDILIDLSGHSRGHRLSVFSQHPAPVAITWIGYLNSTGLRSMDYRISDPFADPPDGHAGTERLLRLPHSFLCIDSMPEVEIRPEPPCIHNGHITFASFNNLIKINRSVIRVWAGVLAAVADSRLVIMADGGDSEIVQRHIGCEFTRFGIDQGRLQFRPRLSRVDYLQFHNEVDIVLDTFPFNGGTVTAGSLWMGVPVVTLVGLAHRQRVSYSMLMNIGIDESIAWTESEYIEKASTLANDPTRLSALRRIIPEAMRNSIICDSKRFTQELESSLDAAWQERLHRR